MASTKSKSPRKSKGDSDAAQDNEAPCAAGNSPQLASEERTKTMSEAPSILSYASAIADAEPPVPLPVGDYPAEIRGAAIKTSQRSGNTYVSISFFVAPEHYPADYTDGNADGELLTYNRLVYEDSPRGRHRMRKFTESIGAPNSGTDVDVNTWVGLSANLAIGVEEFEGEPRAVIQKVTAA